MMDAESGSAGGVKPQITLRAHISPSISIVDHDNGVALLHGLSLSNDSDHELLNIELTLVSVPPVLRPKLWRIDSIAADTVHQVHDLSPTIEPAMLRRLTERETATISFMASSGHEDIASHTVDLVLLPRNHWSGLSGHLPEVIAAFSQPNDPHVDVILKRVSDILAHHGRPTQISGYSKGAGHAWEIANAIWNAVSELKFTYIYPPASFEESGQKVRTPDGMMQSRMGTCLDLTLLFIALLEQASLNPIIVFTKGHAFPGFWANNQMLQFTSTDDSSQLRNSLKLHELMLFESTLVTGPTRIPFSESIRTGAGNVSLDNTDDFILAVDIKQARLAGIRPLASLDLTEPGQSTSEIDTTPELSLEPVPNEILASQVEEELKPTTAQGRLNHWQKKLLDLSLRNRLLNFKPNRKTLQIEVAPASALEDAIARNDKLRFSAPPSVAQSRSKQTQARLTALDSEELNAERIQRELANRILLVNQPLDEIDVALVGLYREARLANEEGGSNTLFLSFGYLSWSRPQDPQRKYLAPLILVPVTLDRTSARSGFTIRAHDDEPRFNPTLIQMLAQDFNLRLPFTDDVLPQDGEGIDVEGVWRRVRHEIQAFRGWEVIEKVHLATFSFSKYLMWKDLVDRTESLSKNLVVRQLLDSGKDGFPNQGEFPRESTLDTKYSPERIFSPLAADSSQLATILAASEGKSFVVIGPPGTGKSQTIANIIVQALSEGKTILFVSEKIAALEVVHRRLRETGLGGFCLELHSNKANKLGVLGQLDTAWNSGASTGSHAIWSGQANRIADVRRNLNLYVNELHKVYPNGLSLFTVFGATSANQDMPELAFEHQPATDDSAELLTNMRNAAAGLQHLASQLPSGTLNSPVFSLIGKQSWSYQFQSDATNATHRLISQLQSAISTLGKFHSRMESTPTLWTPKLTESTVALATLITVMPESIIVDITKPEIRDTLSQIEKAAKTVEEIEEIDSALASLWNASNSSQSDKPAIRDVQSTIALLSVPYDPSIDQADLQQIRADWMDAGKKFFFKRRAKNKVEVTLGRFTQNNALPNPANDLDLLDSVRTKQSLLQQNCEGLQTRLVTYGDLETTARGLWKGSSTNRDHVQWTRDFVEALSTMLVLGSHPDAARFRDILGSILLGPNEGKRHLIELAKAVVETTRPLFDKRQRFFDVMGTPPTLKPDFEQADLQSVLSICESLESESSDLRPWCGWQAARKKALKLGLTDLVTRVESGEVAIDRVITLLEVNYGRIWARKTIDQVPVIRNFLGNEHERKISEFRDLDEAYTRLTSEVVRLRVRSRIPSVWEGGRQSEAGILRHEISKQRRHKPIRRLMSEVPKLVTQITPCFMMSPLSIAQYLPPNSDLFDIVIFDEASQIPVWDAVGAIARGKQVIMVGDQKQLPPTSFFNRADNEEVEEDSVEDLESILDECVTSSMPVRSLAWHYRSRHESLIAFSNRKYYEGKLITFPSPVTDDTAVSAHWVPGQYERGGAEGRTNPIEARAVVEEVISHLRKHPEHSVGVVTFNMPQKELIDHLLDAERINDPALEQFFSAERIEPVMVKNLENVQGDERDVMFFSTTFGRDSAGKISMNFGPLNRAGGERRLNVAITRARRMLKVITSLRAEDIDTSRTNAQGVKDFKTFLDYATRGVQALDTETDLQHSEADSPFEEAVAAAIRGRGWSIHLQIGVSGFRIDLGVVDPDAPGAYLAGVECDGATYHRSATARDRDQIRESVLRGLGWEILRIWSTDWFLNHQSVLDRVDANLNQLLEHRRAMRKWEKSEAMQAMDEVTGEDFLSSTHPSTIPGTTGHANKEVFVAGHVNPAITTGLPQSPFDSSDSSDEQVFRRASNQSHRRYIDPDLFYEPSYDDALSGMITSVVDQEGPVREENLVATIRQWHGWGRAGGRIRSRILDAVPRSIAQTTEADGAKFYWPQQVQPAERLSFRPPDGAANRRSISEIAMPELVGLAESAAHNTTAREMIIRSMCDAIRVERLSASARNRLERAIVLAGF